MWQLLSRAYYAWLLLTVAMAAANAQKTNSNKYPGLTPAQAEALDGLGSPASDICAQSLAAYASCNFLSNPPPEFASFTPPAEMTKDLTERCENKEQADAKVTAELTEKQRATCDEIRQGMNLGGFWQVGARKTTQIHNGKTGDVIIEQVDEESIKEVNFGTADSKEVEAFLQNPDNSKDLDKFKALYRGLNNGR